LADFGELLVEPLPNSPKFRNGAGPKNYIFKIFNGFLKILLIIMLQHVFSLF